jgi:hypothetical protein
MAAPIVEILTQDKVSWRSAPMSGSLQGWDLADRWLTATIAAVTGSDTFGSVVELVWDVVRLRMAR